jgi:hypothetical protein
MSTTTLHQLGSDLNGNHGADLKAVFTGQIHFDSPENSNNPRPFDLRIVLQSPFTYDPSAGNLVIETVFNTCPSTSGGIDFTDFYQATLGVLDRAYAAGATGWATPIVTNGGNITQFVFDPDVIFSNGFEAGKTSKWSSTVGDIQETCDHNVCAEGEPLVSDCSACVAAVCAEDPYCCSTEWDSACVYEATTICDVTCVGECSHDICEVGDALVSGCEPCVTAVCEEDSFCCSDYWDQICVVEVSNVCGLQCL